MSHTPTPWSFDPKGCMTSNGLPIITKANGHLIAHLCDHNAENARRITACVNACEGLPTEALECQAKKNLTGKLIEEHQNMLTALKYLQSIADNPDISSSTLSAIATKAIESISITQVTGA